MCEAAGGEQGALSREPKALNYEKKALFRTL